MPYDDEYHYAEASRRKQERECWNELKKLASEDKILEFYQLYAEYLERNNILSPDRKAIYHMAKKVVEYVQKVEQELKDAKNNDKN